MECVALPSMELVLKVIKDRFGAPKRTTRREVMDRYQFVFQRDRVGRLADAQEFEHLAFRRGCFDERLLAELVAAAPSVVQVAGDAVIVRHLYTERRLVPLDIFAREMPPDDARAAVVDYGQAIKDLAAADIFAGDLLLKNFGVSRHGRVIFYDYDELAAVLDCEFRDVPTGGGYGDDDFGEEPWYTAGEHDVFPDEFARFLVPAGPLRDAFMDAHGDLCTARWWRDVQERLRAGEIVDVFPYARERRLPRA
jgi:isocitrate dehydrogenase kinase/phosphatase